MIPLQVRHLLEEAYLLGFQDGKERRPLAASERVSNMVSEMENVVTGKDSTPYALFRFSSDPDYEVVRNRYHGLVDKEFTEGLSDQETVELNDLDRLIDEYEMSQPPPQPDYVANLNERMDESIEEAEKVHERLDKILGWLEARQSQE